MVRFRKVLEVENVEIGCESEDLPLSELTRSKSSYGQERIELVSMEINSYISERDITYWDRPDTDLLNERYDYIYSVLECAFVDFETK